MIHVGFFENTKIRDMALSRGSFCSSLDYLSSHRALLLAQAVPPRHLTSP